MSGGTVTVRGTAVVPGKPDEIELWLEVTALEQSPAAALDAVARRSASIDELLTELGIAPERRLTTGVSVNEEREFERDRAVHRGYRANNQTKVRLDSAETVGTLMREATERAQARVQGPWWRSGPENPARLEACRQAASDAKRKGQAYADALGLRLGAVTEIREPEAAPAPRPVPVRALMAAAGEPDLPIQAGDLDIAASVDVTFALEEP